MRVLIAAGGTGGHLLPGLAVAKALRERNHRVHFVVKKDRDSQSFLAREGFPSSAFHFEGFPRTLSPRAALFPFAAGAALLAARRIVRREAPDVFLGMGGYLSVPAGLAAVLRRVPMVLHEQNTHAGLANRFLSRWARTVGLSFDPTTGLSPRVGRTVWTGLPLRPDLEPRDPAEARRSLGLDPNAFTLLVFGGSQGARALNAGILDAIPRLARERPDWQFIHLTGAADEEKARTVYAGTSRRAFVRAYFADMAAAYSAADFVVARAGANTVMELSLMGRAALLVPFPHATDDHQRSNARFLEKTGQARVLLEREMDVGKLTELLGSLPEREILRRETKERLSRVPPEMRTAAGRLADWVVEGGE
ncbi:MAG: undecaprenyldiphospho-muramoylpentapeptide beta-N-acetylglucosaminyltransferase [Elusimicrobia bacterium]|nr:undecaprenyldiphospho-muramoylpentapeptide beta-N-acetylglucosaminyltransferase [Elusimicrobiota bacterium]